MLEPPSILGALRDCRAIAKCGTCREKMAAAVTSTKFFPIKKLNELPPDEKFGLYIRTIGLLESRDFKACSVTIKDGQNILSLNTKYIEPFPFK